MRITVVRKHPRLLHKSHNASVHSCHSHFHTFSAFCRIHTNTWKHACRAAKADDKVILLKTIRTYPKVLQEFMADVASFPDVAGGRAKYGAIDWDKYQALVQQLRIPMEKTQIPTGAHSTEMI